MSGKTLEYCVLNVAASPHPPGIYQRILTLAADHETKYWGDRSARISAPMGVEPGLYRGRVATWNDIDFTQPGVSKERLEEIDLREIGNNFPPEVGVNGRIFYYVLRESDHTVFVETRNEGGQTLSPRQAGKIFQSLIDAGLEASDDDIYAEVTVIPDEEVLDQILKMPRLRSLTIRLVRPNADEIGKEAMAILGELEEQGAKSQLIELKAAAGESLKPNERTRLQASVAEYSGFVEGTGSDEDGASTERSTKQHPRLFRRDLDELRSAFSAILSVATEAVFRRADNPDL